MSNRMHVFFKMRNKCISHLHLISCISKKSCLIDISVFNLGHKDGDITKSNYVFLRPGSVRINETLC